MRSNNNNGVGVRYIPFLLLNDQLNTIIECDETSGMDEKLQSFSKLNSWTRLHI